MSMIELSNTKQWKDWLVVDYINHLCSLNLDYRDWLSAALTIEMCLQGYIVVFYLSFNGFDPSLLKG